MKPLAAAATGTKMHRVRDKFGSASVKSDKGELRHALSIEILGRTFYVVLACHHDLGRDCIFDHIDANMHFHLVASFEAWVNE